MFTIISMTIIMVIVVILMYGGIQQQQAGLTLIPITPISSQDVTQDAALADAAATAGSPEEQEEDVMAGGLGMFEDEEGKDESWTALQTGQRPQPKKLTGPWGEYGGSAGRAQQKGGKKRPGTAAAAAAAAAAA